ncbi:MAG TPA: antibiotic biosynthesis monooxygenase [Leeuwenhoekiella sp.]|nr:antibiotic biosynthesis monooxygenase [Leeuwenhoekiella sp.]
MLIRIVKMEFKTEEIINFQDLFEKAAPKIKAFEGCHFVELYQDKTAPNLFFTYSHWDNPEALENYRVSDFFRATWANTKVLFSNKPEAWSVGKVS